MPRTTSAAAMVREGAQVGRSLQPRFARRRWFLRMTRVGRSVAVALVTGLLAMSAGANGPPAGAAVGEDAARTSSSAFAAAFPDTSIGIHVFDDQLAEPLSTGLLHFAATHYDGSQKDPADMVDAL